jgi:hypothetical protein
MPKPSTWLLDFRKNIHSQGGEDGIIEKILSLLPTTDRWCVEFGAWDGEHLSNTRNLIDRHGYRAVLIEGDTGKFSSLAKKFHQNNNVICLNRFIGFGKEDNLDIILSSTPIPHDFDFLSIDIDGNDYHIWKSMAVYQPKVLCIEYNPTIPNGVEFVQVPDPSVTQGSSLEALVRLGKEKQYELISVVEHNAFFVLAGYYPLFQIENNTPCVLRTEQQWVTHIFSGYDGTVFLRGNQTLPWHGIQMHESRMQHLPAHLRTFPDNYTPWQRRAFAVYHLLASVKRNLRLLSQDFGAFRQKVLRRLRR